MVSATEQSIFLSPQAREVVNYDKGLIVISGNESSGKSTTVNLLAEEFRAGGKIPVVIRFGLHNTDLPLPEGYKVIMLPFLETVLNGDEDLECQQDEIISEAFGYIGDSDEPYVFIVDDLPAALTRKIISLALFYPVVVSVKASSALMAADKLCFNHGIKDTHGFGSQVQEVLAVSIWQQLLTLDNGKKVLRSYAV